MSRKRLTAAGLIIVTAISLSGCALGFDAATNKQKPSGNGVSINAGDLEIRNATLVTDPATPGTAIVIVTIYNRSDNPDSLVGMKGPNGMSATTTGDLSIPAHEAVQIGYNSPNEIVLTGNATDLTPGHFVKIGFIFQNTPAVDASLLVNENNGIYEGVTVSAPAPSPSAS